MTPADVYIDFFERVLENGVAVVGGLDEDELAHRPAPDANSIAWLVWHAARVQDAQLADVAGTEQVWFSEGWVDRFGLDLDPQDHGYGHTSEQVGKVRASGELLADYLRACHAASVAYLRTVTEADLDRIVDERWDPPVSLGVRLVSIADDDAQHVGQAAYLRGLLGR
ncbi:mycothiol transferase [Nocardioides sp.]|uniref:mycothiol transferase n=1 Tax=Nocardioides sp. TaxID=35761 RepID=UPI0037846D54